MNTATRLTVALTISLCAIASAQQTPPAPPLDAAEWRSYGHDLGNSRYSPLDLLNRDTLGKVQVVWKWRSDNFSVPPETRNESTPIMVNGTLYFTAGATRWVVAADAVTGATKWTWHLDEGDRARRAPRRDSGRGVSFWSGPAGADGKKDERIFTVTPGFNLVALDAKTGMPVATFGDHGVVDLKAQLGVPVDLVNAAIGSSSPPLVFENAVVIGPALEVGTRPPSMKNVPGRVLAIDARTGALAWSHRSATPLLAVFASSRLRHVVLQAELETFAIEADGTVAWRIAHSDVVTEAAMVGGRLVLTAYGGGVNSLDPSTGRGG